jgi:hypothetical protein
MVHPRAIPTNLPQKPTNLPESDGKGLSVGATVGIGIGIALLVILGAAGAWIFVRRRRRNWAQKRREQGDLGTKGDTPNAEIAKKIRMNEKSDSVNKPMGEDGAVENGGGLENRAELGGVDTLATDNKPSAEADMEFYHGAKAYEMPTTAEPVEIGEGKTFAAELEGSTVVPKPAER